MVSLIATTAKEERVDHFRRFDLMRHWHETEHLPFKTLVSPDGLHMNDWSYACFAKGLGLAIAEAAERPTTTAIGPTIALKQYPDSLKGFASPLENTAIDPSQASQMRLSGSASRTFEGIRRSASMKS